MAYELWKEQLAAGGMLGVEITPITRGKEWSCQLQLGGDRTLDTITANLRVDPGASVLQAVTVTKGGYASGKTPVRLTLTATQTALAGVANNGAAVAFLYWEISQQFGGSGGVYRTLGGAVALVEI